jgi:hypothetical protein
VDIQSQNSSKEYGKFSEGVKELRTECKSKMYKLVDKTGGTSVEMNEVMEEVRNYFEELSGESTIIIEEKESIMSNEKDEEV